LVAAFGATAGMDELLAPAVAGEAAGRGMRHRGRSRLSLGRPLHAQWGLKRAMERLYGCAV